VLRVRSTATPIAGSPESMPACGVAFAWRFSDLRRPHHEQNWISPCKPQNSPIAECECCLNISHTRYRAVKGIHSTSPFHPIAIKYSRTITQRRQPPRFEPLTPLPMLVTESRVHACSLSTQTGEMQKAGTEAGVHSSSSLCDCGQRTEVGPNQSIGVAQRIRLMPCKKMVYRTLQV
jgi:hypothetical protein